ncbi:MAG: Do family serine endopeptidase [Saprospiraceae bacterium]|nr:Do family serine endopeptidase [Saprospiraceae bacterium]
MNKNFIYSGLVALVVSLTCVGAINLLQNSNKTFKIEHITKTPASKAVFTLDENDKIIPLDFTKTADEVVDAVVHIRSTHIYNNNNKQNFQYRNIPDPFRDFFGDNFNRFFGPNYKFESPNMKSNKPPTKVGSGSGVIVSEDGYIITNNHVIADADDIEVTLHDNRTYKATVIGTDPTTDLALVQIKEKNLPKISFVDSDKVKIGEWVLAVGNPFSLNSTITAGIVSAKGRNINILKEQYAVENFIQTDAAINPGNSGGALVNLDGGLIGINTAIASPTGVYSGYGFAVPSNIVAKVMEDLLKYGVVQRGVLGIMIRTVDGNLAKDKDLDIISGVYVDSLMQTSAAKDAGIKVGDVILKVNDVEIKSSPELQGMIARYRPGETVELLINREGKENVFKVVLNNRDGNKALTSKENVEILNILGADLKDLDKEEAKKLDIDHGVEVTKLYPGKLRKHTQIREGFIITHLDGKKVKSKEDLINALEKKKGGVMLEGVYKDIPGEYYYAFGL